jgi:hypothetical protein
MGNYGLHGVLKHGGTHSNLIVDLRKARWPGYADDDNPRRDAIWLIARSAEDQLRVEVSAVVSTVVCRANRRHGDVEYGVQGRHR